MAKGRQLTAEQVLAILREGPRKIAAAVADAAPDQLHARPGPEEWSANEVLAHLRACSDVWGRCIETILREDHPTIRGVNPRTWIRDTDYVTQRFKDSFRAFTAQRDELVGVLERLAPGDWSRSATITGAGKPLTKTVHNYAHWLATHERPHVKQIARAVQTLGGNLSG